MGTGLVDREVVLKLCCRLYMTRCPRDSPQVTWSTRRRNGGEKWDARDWLEEQTPICPEIPGLSASSPVAESHLGKSSSPSLFRNSRFYPLWSINK